MAETEFRVVYDGPALQDGRMAVRDLAPALLALGDLFAAASLVAYPDRDPVALEIKATAEGSFDVHMLLHAADAWDKFVQFFSGDVVTALVQLKDFIIGGTTVGGGLLWLAKRLRGRSVKSRGQPGPGTVRLVLDDETSVEIAAQVWELYQNVEVRKDAKRVVEPLTREGVNELEFRTESRVSLRLEKSDVPAFDVPELEEVPLVDEVLEMVVTITAPSFVEGNKWRFTAGDETFFAAIEDRDFLARVDHGEAFRKGDMLRCRMRLVQSRRGATLSTERYVVKVIEHLPRGVQLRLGLPFPDPAE